MSRVGSHGRKAQYRTPRDPYSGGSVVHTGCMRRFYHGILDRLDDASFMRKFHGWSAVLWLTAGTVVSVILSNSVPYVVFLSAYAIVVSHWSSWQAARVEEKQDATEPPE
jgi:hypothetical protein